MKNKESKLFYIVFFILGLFPLLPFKFKPIGVALSILLGLFILMKNKKIHFSKMYLNNSILFFTYIFSYFLSIDKIYAAKYIETSMPIILFPLFFLFISKTNFTKQIWNKIEMIFYKVFFISSIIYSILIFIYIYFLGYFSGKVTYDYTLSYISNMFWGLSDDLILISISLVFSLFFSIKIIKIHSKFKLIIWLGNILLLLTLIYISRKGVLIAGLVSFIYLIYKEMKALKIKILTLIFTLLSMVFFYVLFPSSSKRIKQLFQVETYTKPLDLKNSTSIRLQVYKCAFSNIEGVGLLGYGIGDVKNKLQDCYQINAKSIANQNLNTHNVFLNILLGHGYLGLMIVFLMFFNLFKLSINNNDVIFTAILLFYVIEFLTENILDRQNGVILFAFLINFYSFKNLIRLNLS